MNAEEREELKQKALKAYQFSQHKSERGVSSANPARMTLSLHYAIFLYDIDGKRGEALDIARKAMTIAEKKMDNIVDDDVRKDAETVFALLDNFVKQCEAQRKAEK